ncbi:MAG: ATP-binding protein, partial [Planctomycetota bacterium]
EKMASIGTLARGVAHEFNNLMGGIRGCTAEALAAEKSEDHRELLQVILRAADRAAEITSKLLRFSKQEALRPAHVDIKKVMNEALLLIEPDARKRNVTILRKFEETPEVWADSSALHQVLLNLYTNALQAMPEGGELVVETDLNEDALLIRVGDTGVGIPQDQIDHIFEPFFTTKAQKSDPFSKGTGLGLSVSYSLIDAHGGRIDVRSQIDVGTVFTITLPFSS